MASQQRGIVSVLMGGTAAEREISLKTGKAIVAALHRTNVPAVGVTLERDDLDALPEATSVAFLALHGGFGEDGRIQGQLETRGIPYTGSGPQASRLAMDKIASRRVLLEAGCAVATAETAEPGARTDVMLEHIGLPCVVKPRSEGSSLGVSMVRHREQLAPALAAAWSFGQAALVERFVAGTELTVAVLQGRALPPVEVLPRDEFFTFDAKYGGHGTTYLIDPPLPPAVRSAVEQTALAAYQAFGCRHYARVDVIVRPSGQPIVLEVNTLPGMTDTSLFPMAAKAAGLTFEGLCKRLLDLARADGARREQRGAA